MYYHLVYFNIHCRVSAVSSPSGKFDITGLPFNFGNNGTSRCRVSLSVWAYIAGSGLTAGDSFQAMGTEDTDEITIHKGNKGETNYFNHIGSEISKIVIISRAEKIKEHMGKKTAKNITKNIIKTEKTLLNKFNLINLTFLEAPEIPDT